MRKKNCVQCGCDRKLMSKCEVIVQSGENSFAMKYKALCFRCLLQAVGLLSNYGELKIDKSRMMEMSE